MPNEQEREDWISRRAYELWEQSGKPDGKDYEHWSIANAEWESRQSTATKGDEWDEEIG